MSETDRIYFRMNQMSQRGGADKMIPDDVESASLLGRPIEEHKKKRKYFYLFQLLGSIKEDEHIKLV